VQRERRPLPLSSGAIAAGFFAIGTIALLGQMDVAAHLQQESVGE
jgi:hypothetical protein